MSNLNELLGIPKTYISTAQPGDVVLVHVDPENTEEQMLAYGNKVKEALPECIIVVLPNTVTVSAFQQQVAKEALLKLEITE